MMATAHDTRRRHSRTRIWIVLAFFAVVGGYLLTTEHRAHLLGALPLLLIFALCPLMHMFMHGGHGGHSGHGSPRGPGASADAGLPAEPHRHQT